MALTILITHCLGTRPSITTLLWACTIHKVCWLLFCVAIHSIGICVWSGFSQAPVTKTRVCSRWLSSAGCLGFQARWPIHSNKLFQPLKLCRPTNCEFHSVLMKDKELLNDTICTAVWKKLCSYLLGARYTRTYLLKFCWTFSVWSVLCCVSCLSVHMLSIH